ncbi:MAG: hypothetical protein QNJ47_17105 [Nostocaceae cyanobacterium]|nr:hypothetical protein [Nostocaceae cyanobacterium]
MLLLIKTSSAINTLGRKANENIRLKGSNVHFLTLKLQGKGSTFLKEFYQSIHPQKRTIDQKKLLNHPNFSFAFGFRQLLDEFTNPSLDCIKYSHIDDICYVPEKAYFVLVDWIKTQIIYQYELESQIFNFGILERTVKFELPSKS